MLLSQRALAAFRDREFDSFDWMKRLSREQLLRHMAGFRIKPEFKTDPWLHQLVCHYIGSCEPRFLFLLDMGAGKSKIITDLINQAYRERRWRGRALVMAPRVINIDHWANDIPKHSDLEPFPIDVEEIEEKRYNLLHPKGDVTIIDYMGLGLALTKKGKRRKGRKMVSALVPDPELVAKAQALYRFIGIDESHKLRNQDSLWFDLIDRLSETADQVYATTGTLFGRSPLEAWPQFKLVDRGETFGSNDSLFLGTFFTEKQNEWRGSVPQYIKGKTRLLNKMMAHRSIRYDEDEISDLPPRVYRRLEFNLVGEQEEHYKAALQGLYMRDGQSSEMEAPWLRMRQITSGYLKWKDANGDHIIHFRQNPKLEATISLIEDVGTSKVLICYDYTPTGAMLCKRLEKEGIKHEWFYGGTKDKPASKRRFMQDPDCKVMVANSEAVGTGTDGLQEVARYMIFYESPTPPITRKQTEKRIDRPGGIGQAFYYDLVCRKTVDAGILTSLGEGRDLYDDVMRGNRRGLLGGA